MKKIGLYIGLLLLLVGVACCTDDTFSKGSDTEVRVTGVVGVSSKTFYTVGEDAIVVSWEEGDEIGILSEKQPEAMCYRAVSGGKQTDFVPETDRLKREESIQVFAYYPYTEADVSYPYVPLPYLFGQDYRAGLLDPEDDFMCAKGVIENGTLTLNFKHLFAFLKLNIRTELLKGTQGLLVRSDEPIAYIGEDVYAYYDLEADTLCADKYDYLWYYIPEDVLEKQEIVTCYVAVLPTSEKNTISFFLHDKDGSYEQGLFERKAPKGGLQAGHVYDLSIEQNDFDEIMRQEREAMIAFYEAAGGDNWTNNTNWCSDRPLNEWYGVNYWNGHVRVISLDNNNLTGQIPEQIGQLTALEYLSLSNNYLFGQIPESIGELRKLFSLNLSVNQLEGQLPASIGNLELLTYLNLYKNNLTGSLPVSMARLNQLEYLDLCGNCLSGVIPDEILACEWWKRQGLSSVIYQKDGYNLSFPMYESSDYSMDGTVVALQNHTVGYGLKVVILGEAYSDRLISDGTYRQHAEMAMEAFFSEEPYASFRHYFDVYLVNVVSRNEILGGNTAFQTSYEFDRNTFETNPSIAIEYISRMVETNNAAKDVTSIILMNSDAPFRSVCWQYSDGFSAAFCLFNGDGESLANLIHHEVCGHGFGRLSDEYVEYEGVYPYPESIIQLHELNEAMNVDVTNDPEKIVWSYFLSDIRYSKEKIGIYEGAIYHPKGIYRATENSIMRYNTGGFNAPSRQSIYRRIMEQSGGVYNFEDFLEYDEINRQRINQEINTRTMSVSKEKMGLPPIRCDYPSSEAKYHEQTEESVNVPLR